jgi:hypothetical protein
MYNATVSEINDGALYALLVIVFDTLVSTDLTTK